MTETVAPTPPQVNSDDIKTEYDANSNHYIETVKIRFATPVFYLAAVAYLLKENTIRTLIALILITLFVGILEQRTRQWLWMLRRRGSYIETHHWSHKI